MLLGSESEDNECFKVNIDDPLELGEGVGNILQEKPLFLYVRRWSCCCQGCKLTKEMKGLQLVLESDLVGKKLQFKNLIARAT